MITMESCASSLVEREQQTVREWESTRWVASLIAFTAIILYLFLVWLAGKATWNFIHHSDGVGELNIVARNRIAFTKDTKHRFHSLYQPPLIP